MGASVQGNAWWPGTRSESFLLSAQILETGPSGNIITYTQISFTLWLTRCDTCSLPPISPCTTWAVRCDMVSSLVFWFWNANTFHNTNIKHHCGLFLSKRSNTVYEAIRKEVWKILRSLSQKPTSFLTCISLNLTRELFTVKIMKKVLQKFLFKTEDEEKGNHWSLHILK